MIIPGILDYKQSKKKIRSDKKSDKLDFFYGRNKEIIDGLHFFINQ